MSSAPLTPEQVDLLLSADLDGEFDGAAADLGLDPAAARALLESVPGLEARGAALAAARDRLAEPVEIDELLAARLRAKALKAGVAEAEGARREQGRRRTRLYGIVGGIAAALIVVVALGATLNTNSSSDGDMSSAGGTADLAPVAIPTTPGVESGAGDDLANGDDLPLRSSYSSVEALTEDVSARREAFSSKTADATTRYESSNGASDGPGEPAKAASAPSKCAAVAQGIDPAALQLAQGMTEIAGQPVSAFLYLSADGRTLYFFDANCKIVNRQRLN